MRQTGYLRLPLATLLIVCGMRSAVRAQPEVAPPPRPVPVAPVPTRPLIVPPAAPPTTSPALTQGLNRPAESRARSAERTFLPPIFGDQPGGGTVAGPLPVRIGAGGQVVGPQPVVVPAAGQPVGATGVTGRTAADELLLSQPVVVLPNGQRLTLSTANRTAADELLLSRSTNPNGATTVLGVTPPDGSRFDESARNQVSRIPQVVRGAFKIAENDTPRPTTRVYTSYYFYDQLFNHFGGRNFPRLVLHQEVFGYEQAFADRQFAVGVRLPYNQLVSPGFLTSSSLGDLTVITKAVLLENEATGNLLSGGLAVTAPTGRTPFPSTVTGQVVHPTLLQPFLGYIYRRGDLFLQGFSSVTVPTDARDVTFVANDVAVGYFARRSPGSVVSAVIPVCEVHLNTPLNHRGLLTDPVGYVDQLTMLGGTHIYLFDRSSLGAAVGAPVTGPRPFSLQVTVQFNLRF